MALRPPVSIEKKNQEKNFIADQRAPEQTPVGILTKSFDTKDYIQLLYDTVAMAKPNDFRRPHHLEILKIDKELKEPFKSNFLKGTPQYKH